MKTFEFTEEQRHELIEIFVHGTIQELLSRIETIVSERITPEPKAMKLTEPKIYDIIRKVNEFERDDKGFKWLGDQLESILTPSAPIAPEQCDGWVSDEDIDKEFPSTYAELSHRLKPTETLNAEYLEENGIDFFENFAKKEGAKWMRNKLSCNANKS